MNGQAKHPSTDRLHAFVVGLLNDTESSSIEVHIETCADCQANLSRLSDQPDTFLDRLRPKSGSYLAGSDTFLFPAPDRSDPAAPGPLLAPPGYEVLEELGRGGMGVVYKALHVRLKRLIALKMLLAGRSASRSESARFRAEAEAIARLDHPHIVKIHEIGEFEGLTYLALEYVSGGTLLGKLGGRPQPPRAAARLTVALARAISEAHRKGIVHRDLKPGNILLEPGEAGVEVPGAVEGYGSPKVTDFGLAKWLAEDRGQTAVQSVAGTPSYMAPEQVSTAHHPISPATDIYALGVILYEMLIGRPPFQGTSATETFALIEASDPIPPRRLRLQTPRDLETICLKCLQKDPAKRYASANELGDDLERYLDGFPIKARPTRWLERTARLIRRRPAVSGLIAALVLVGALGLTGVFWQWGVALYHWQRAETALSDSDDHLYLARISQAQLEWRLNHQIHEVTGLLDACRPRAGEFDRRGWEWFYLKRLIQQRGRSLQGVRNGYTEAVAFSPDGRLAAACGSTPFVVNGQNPSNEVTLWDHATGELLQRFMHEAPRMNGMAFSADGNRLVLGYARDLRIVDLTAWRLAGYPPLQKLPVRDVTHPFAKGFGITISPDGNRIVLTGAARHLLIIDITGKAEPKLIPISGEASGGAFLDDGRFATCVFDSGRQELLIFDRNFDRTERRDLGKSERTPRVKFSRDGRMVATTVNKAQLWDVASGRLINVLGPDGAGNVNGVDFHPDLPEVALAMSDRTIRILDRESGAERVMFWGHVGRVSSVAFHPSGKHLISGSQQPGEVKLWDPAEKPEQFRFTPAGHYASEGLAFDPTGKRLLAAMPGGRIDSVDPKTGESTTLGQLDITPFWITPGTLTTFSGDGRFFAAACGPEAKRVRVWDIQPPSEGQPEILAERPLHLEFLERAYQLSMSQDGRLLASATLGRRDKQVVRTIRVHNVETGALLLERPPQTSTMGRYYGAICISPDGTRLAYNDSTTTPDGSTAFTLIRIIDVRTGKDSLSLQGHDGMITSLAFSSDGQTLASGQDKQVIVWNLKTGQRLHARPLSGPALQLAFSPDGRRLAGVDREELKLWDVRTGREVITLRGASFRSGDIGINPKVAWSNDGLRLSASNHDRSVSIWDASGAED